MTQQKRLREYRYWKMLFGSMRKSFWTYGCESLSQKVTNLPVPVVLWMSLDFGRKISPRIIVQPTQPDQWNSKLFAITIEDLPRVVGDPGKLKEEEVEKIRMYIITNKETLLHYWFQREIDVMKIFRRLKTYE